MKKSTLLTCACALVFGAQSLFAQETAQEVTYVSDPSQGYLINRMKDNWFITAEGGAGVYISNYATQRNFGDRFAPAASIYAGKWFTPVFGARIGVNFMQLKGVSKVNGISGVLQDEPMVNGEFYKQKFSQVGPVLDIMVNLTNWWCGYKPNRIYNATFYAGVGTQFTLVKDYDENGNADGWKDGRNAMIPIRAGLINSFNVSKQVQLSLDLRMDGMKGHQNEAGSGWSQTFGNFQAYLGVTYLFKEREWKAPVVPVCPEPENCDALRARLSAADARISDLEQQLKDCLARPVETVVENNGPLASVYYPIGVSRISRENTRVIKAIAEVMKANPDTKYVITGWADNWTGSEKVNERLRKNRAEGVAKVLVANGVPESQFTITNNSTDRYPDLGEKCVALGRAVTIEESK